MRLPRRVSVLLPYRDVEATIAEAVETTLDQPGVARRVRRKRRAVVAHRAGNAVALDQDILDRPVLDRGHEV
jgi:hypothetical protein